MISPNCDHYMSVNLIHALHVMYAAYTHPITDTVHQSLNLDSLMPLRGIRTLTRHISTARHPVELDSLTNRPFYSVLY